MYNRSWLRIVFVSTGSKIFMTLNRDGECIMEYDEEKDFVSSVDFIETNPSREKDQELIEHILKYFKENEHYIEWRKENILNQFTNQILDASDYFDFVNIQALPIDEEIKNFIDSILEENDTAREGMEQLTDQVSESQTESLRLQNELKEAKEKLANAIELNKQLVKEKWYQKLFRSFSDYKYKYEIEGGQNKSQK